MTNKPKILSNNLAPKVGDAYENELNNPEVHNQIIEAFDESEKNISLASSSTILSSSSIEELEKIRNSIDFIKLKSKDPYFKDFQDHMKYYYLLITKRPFGFDIGEMSIHHLRFRIDPTCLGISNKSLENYMSNFKNFDVHNFANIYNKKLNDIKIDYEILIKQQDESDFDTKKVLFKKKFMTKRARSLFIELWMVAKIFLEQSIFYKDYENEKFLRGREEFLFAEVVKIDDTLKNIN